MYESHWGLARKPFEEAVDAESYFPSGPHQGALLKLRYAVENRRGAAVLTGAAGVGKSMIVQRLFNELEDEHQPRKQIVFPQFSHDELLAYVAGELTDRLPSKQKAKNVKDIQEFLTENGADRHAVIAMDEAHLIHHPETLETLRLLLNFQANDQPCLTILLVGQPQILAYLSRNPGFDDRIAVKCLLRPLNRDETFQYVNHRLESAGASTGIFDDEAKSGVFEFSGGTPRRINRLCDMALLIGFAEGHETIGYRQIADVSEEIVSIRPEAA